MPGKQKVRNTCRNPAVGRAVAGTWQPVVVVLFFKEIWILMKILSLWYKCCCSVAQSCPTVCDPMDCSTPGFPVLHYLPEFAQYMSIELVMPSNHLVLCGPLLLLQSFPASGSFPMCQLFASGGQSTGALEKI